VCRNSYRILLGAFAVPACVGCALRRLIGRHPWPDGISQLRAAWPTRRFEGLHQGWRSLVCLHQEKWWHANISVEKEKYHVGIPNARTCADNGPPRTSLMLPYPAGTRGRPAQNIVHIFEGVYLYMARTHGSRYSSRTENSEHRNKKKPVPQISAKSGRLPAESPNTCTVTSPRDFPFSQSAGPGLFIVWKACGCCSR
jgi:hypothetical protein